MTDFAETGHKTALYSIRGVLLFGISHLAAYLCYPFLRRNPI